jgi:hypothetical protein
MTCTCLPARLLCLLHVWVSAGFVGEPAPCWAVACHEPSGVEVSLMYCGYELMEQLLGNVRCKDTEPCATANDEVAVTS